MAAIMRNLLLLMGVLLLLDSVNGFALSTMPVSKLLAQEASKIAALKADAATVTPVAATALNDVYYLRYCLGNFESDEARADAVKANVAWMYTTPQGKSICEAADQAIQTAMSDGKWNNEPVRSAAPHAELINEFLTPSEVVTTVSNQGDLVYCIRAGAINDAALMDKVSIDQMTDFFLYTKHVNAQVANMRSLDQDRLVCVVTANDLSGIKLIGGSKDFRKALGGASKQANDLYPTVSGPTLLLNLPKLLSGIVKLFTPLFSKEVRERLKFERGPLSDVKDLKDISPSGNPAAAKLFLSQIDGLIYK